jgi:hypothetical protein
MVNYIKVLLMELKAVQTIMNILADENNKNEVIDQTHRHTSISTSRDFTNLDRHNSNRKDETSEW